MSNDQVHCLPCAEARANVGHNYLTVHQVVLGAIAPQDYANYVLRKIITLLNAMAIAEWETCLHGDILGLVPSLLPVLQQCEPLCIRDAWSSALALR